jgi:phosphoribosyl-ATP pyrophosphohydrolase
MVEILQRLGDILEQRKQASAGESYVASLYTQGTDAILKKIGEEATETILAAKGNDARALIHEVADLWFHSLVLLAHKGLSADAVMNELAHRFGVSGLQEKADRQGK